MIYDSDFLNKISDSVNLIEYVASCGYDTIKRRDKHWMNCPLHEDKTPSLMIDSQNRFHCFSCNTHGGIIGWLQHIEGRSFKDAVEKAAKMAGTDVAHMCSSETFLFNKNLMKKRYKTTVVHSILPETTYSKFQKATPEEWLSEGISKEAMNFFDIRYDPRSSRIVYPVRMIDGELIGVKGRSVFSTDECKQLGIAKYMNMFEIGTADFLQSLDKTKSFVKEQGEIILFEGIKSCMKAFDWGYKNCAAVESHSINPFQVKLLIKLGVDVVVAFDSDVDLKAKDTAALRESLNTLSMFTNVYVIQDKDGLLGGKDAKNSPVDCGFDIWKQLYSQRSRWKRDDVR